jgi:hypothetical protein
MRPADFTAATQSRRGMATVLATLLACVGGPALAGDDPADIAGLITQLGDAEFAVRETAAARLSALGMTASDALLLAVESSTDLEVVLRARALAEALPIAAPHDTAEVAAELSRFGAADTAGRIRIMHRLLRLDDDAGIEPLARIVRLERTALGSRIAAALLAREWQRGDPCWPELCRRITAGVERSDRPAARFLRGLVAQTLAGDEGGAGLDTALEAWVAMDRDTAADQPEPLVQGRAAGDANRVLDAADTRRIFRRCLVELLVAAGRRDTALQQAQGLFADCHGTLDGESHVADELVWLADHGLPEAVDLVGDWLGAEPHPLPAYAAALAWRKRPEADAATRAEALAARARDRLAAADGSAVLVTAMELARWGAVEWSLREYQTVLENEESSAGEFAFAGIFCAEFLHEQGRDAEAGRVLAAVVAGRETETEDMDRVLHLLRHEPETVKSRMLYFEACAALSRGDAPGAERLLAESLRVHPRDVESLISLYRLAGADPARLAEVAERVARALAATDELIDEHPQDAVRLKNEYAWLVVNTRGDARKATRYSRQTLEQSFDSAGFLDTLAHCRAATGDRRGAVRLQRVALRMDPHSPMLAKNLRRFEAAEAAP